MRSKTVHKIVLFNSDLVGGAGKFIVTLAKALKNTHVEVHIIIYVDNMDYAVPEGIYLHLLKQNGQVIDQKKGIVKALKNQIDEIGQVDFFMSNSSPANKLLSMVSHPNIYHCVHSAETKEHRGILWFWKALLRKRKYKKLYSHKNLITVSKALEEYILDDIKAKPKRLQTIYNPFDFDEIHYLSEKIVNEIPNTAYLIHVGRFDMVSKRQDLLLKAYKKADLSQKLVLIGEGKDREKIEMIVNELRTW